MISDYDSSLDGTDFSNENDRYLAVLDDLLDTSNLDPLKFYENRGV